jgi:hypothetical protein
MSYTTVLAYRASGKYIILSGAVLYGCESWSLTLRDEHRLRVFENRVLRGLPENGGGNGERELFNQQVEQRSSRLL